MFIFAYPYLFLLIFLPYIFRFIGKTLKYDKNISIFLPNITNLEKSFGKANISSFSARIIIKYIIWILFVVAIMRPQISNKKIKILNDGRNIIIASDISGSMRALDFSSKTEYLSRLDILKRTTSEFISERRGDRIGLVLFGDNAYFYTPLTSDLKSVNKMLNTAMIGMAGNATAIGDAIGLSVKKLRDLKNNSSIIVLLTDGENTSGALTPIIAAEIAKEYNIKIYVIGIGKSGIAPISDEYGNIFNSRVSIDEDSLKRIAKITNGKYFNVVNQNMMRNIYKEINKIEKSENKSREFFIKKEIYQYFLFSAIILLIGYIFQDRLYLKRL